MKVILRKTKKVRTLKKVNMQDKKKKKKIKLLDRYP